jgi:hypothetical protein
MTSRRLGIDFVTQTFPGISSTKKESKLDVKKLRWFDHHFFAGKDIHVLRSPPAGDLALQDGVNSSEAVAFSCSR